MGVCTSWICISGSVSNVVWSTTNAEAEVLSKIPDKDFLEELNLAFTEGGVKRVPPEAIEVNDRDREKNSFLWYLDIEFLFR